MTEALEVANKINKHIAGGGEVWNLTYAGAKGVREAYAEGESLWAYLGRSRRSVCLMPDYVTMELRREWRHLRFR